MASLTSAQRSRFYDYCNENRSVYSEQVVQNFFKIEQNIEILLRAIDGDSTSQRELEDRFRKHYFRVRFIKYLASTIKFCTIDQLRMNRKIDTRNQLIFDRPCSEEREGTVGEMLLGIQYLPESEPIITNPSQFHASLLNDQLAKAFAALTPKQQLIATLCYALCYQDNEVAKIIGVSPQAICKTRNLALQKLRLAMPERR